MDTQKKAGPLHKFMDHPIIAGVVATILFYALLTVMGAISTYAGISENITNSILVAIFIVIYIVYRKSFKGELPGKVPAKTIMLGFLLLAPLIIQMLANLAGGIMDNPDIPASFVLTVFLTSLEAGVCEEITLRGLFSENMMRVNHTEKAILINALIPSIAFALIHLVNILSGATVEATIVQFLSTFASGFLYSAVMFRTGSIIPGIVVHTLFDFCSMLGTSMSEGISEDFSISKATGSITQAIIAGLVLAAFYLSFALFYLRKKKRASIVDCYTIK